MRKKNLNSLILSAIILIATNVSRADTEYPTRKRLKSVQKTCFEIFNKQYKSINKIVYPNFGFGSEYPDNYYWSTSINEDYEFQLSFTSIDASFNDEIHTCVHVLQSVIPVNYLKLKKGFTEDSDSALVKLRKEFNTNYNINLGIHLDTHQMPSSQTVKLNKSWLSRCFKEFSKENEGFIDSIGNVRLIQANWDHGLNDHWISGKRASDREDRTLNYVISGFYSKDAKKWGRRIDYDIRLEECKKNLDKIYQDYKDR